MLSFAVIDRESMGEVTERAIDRREVSQSGTARFDCFGNHLDDAGRK